MVDSVSKIALPKPMSRIYESPFSIEGKIGKKLPLLLTHSAHSSGKRKGKGNFSKKKKLKKSVLLRILFLSILSISILNHFSV